MTEKDGQVRAKTALSSLENIAKKAVGQDSYISSGNKDCEITINSSENNCM